jgi:L-amino acid N-acyltransferase YncA
MNTDYNIRLVNVTDAPAILEVYKPYVLTTANTFEYEVPVVGEIQNRIKKISAQYPYLVCEHDGRIIGYTYGSTHRERTAYQWSAEVTVYVSEEFHRRGVARTLYNALFPMLRMQGYHSMYAGVLSTNIKSVEFHRAMGFEDIGLFKNIGYKLGEWHSNLWMQGFLREHDAEPTVPVAIGVIDKQFVEGVIRNANEEVNI